MQQAQALEGASTLCLRARTEHPWLAPAQTPDEWAAWDPSRLRHIGLAAWGWFTRAKTRIFGRVALKATDPFWASQDGPRRRFLHEARAMAALTHDHIVPIYQVGEERGVLFLAMPFLQGETLEVASAAHRPGSRPGRRR